MKNFYLIIVAVMLSSCMSVAKFNKHLEKPIAPEKLRQDVDYSYKNLQKLHPKLYWYISKEALDHKFDSLKTTITTPLTPSAFFEKLAPVIAEIREGHLSLNVPFKRFTKEEIKNLGNQKGLFSRMDYVIDQNRIFVQKNKDTFANIQVGTEITKIQDIPASAYLNRYQKYVNSDGFNTTFQKYSMARRWPTYFVVENGIMDSVRITTAFKGEIREFYIHREKIGKDEKKKQEEENKEKSKSQAGKTKNYDVFTKSYNRDLQFPLKDSTIAYMKIKTFSGAFSRRFYRESFTQIKNSPAKYLILDIRDNLGGSLSEINNLYSYLVDREFKFVKDMEITSPSAIFHADYLKKMPRVVRPFALAFYPFYLTGTALSIKKNDGKTFLRNNGIFTVKKPKSDNFKGQIYVLVNGSSFSAASILPSKLKDDKRAVIVGEETGGANDGTVAGRYATKKLPNSKLLLPMGLILIQPNITFTHTGKGVEPDVKITPTFHEIIEEKDVQLDWVMTQIQKKEEAS